MFLTDHAYRFLIYDVNWSFEIVNRNEFVEDCVRDERRFLSNVVLKACVVQNSKNWLSEHNVHCRKRFEKYNDVQFVKSFNVFVVIVVSIVIVVVVIIVFVVFSFSFVASIVSIFSILLILVAFQMRMLVSTFIFHVIISFAVSAILHLNDDEILDRKRKSSDCHNHDWFENKATDANV